MKQNNINLLKSVTRIQNGRKSGYEKKMCSYITL